MFEKRDHGVATWVAFYPGRVFDLSVGYNRSQRYGLNTLFFGIGWTFAR